MKTAKTKGVKKKNKCDIIYSRVAKRIREFAKINRADLKMENPKEQEFKTRIEIRVQKAEEIKVNTINEGGIEHI